MFVPVSCTSCGKPFQVPQEVLGQPTTCPWCQVTVLALPVAPAVAPPPAIAPEPLPLPLDDEPPAAKPEPQPVPVPRPPISAFKLAMTLLVGLFVMLLVTVATLGALRRKDGYMVGTEWRMFNAPDGSCTVDLLGKPVEDPNLPAIGARRYDSEGWYSGTRAWVGWKDLNSVEARMAVGPEAWQLLRPIAIEPERKRLHELYGGYEAGGGGTKSFEPLVVEYRLQTDRHGLLVARFIVKPEGPRPRVYYVGIVGKRITPDGPEVSRLFESFRTKD